jgi:hypothetical protein
MERTGAVLDAAGRRVFRPVSLRRLLTLAAIWWAAQLLLALPVAITFWAWAAPRVALAPATDVLVHGFDIATVSDLLQAEHGGIVNSAWAGAMFAAGCSALLAPLMVAGTLGVLRKVSDRRAVGAFLTAAADPLWPLVAIGGATRGVAALLARLAANSVAPLVRVVGGEFWEPGPFVSVVLTAAAGLLIWWTFVVIGDVALVQRTEAPRRSTLTSVFSATVILIRHPVALGRRWLLIYAAPAGLVQAVYLLVSDRLLAVPVLLVLAQQAVMFVRALCRVRVIAAERLYVLEWKTGRSARQENQVRPGKNREREIQERQDAERPVHLEQVQEHRASDGEQLGGGQARPDTSVPE